jgi:hypothetical protein
VQRANLLPGIATIAAAFMFSGCFPSLPTSRPEAEIIVTDESGAPIEGVTVTLETREWHGIGSRSTFEEFPTDHEGRVRLSRQSEWAVQIMLPDGDVHYSWALCFSKPGFEAIPMITMKFDKPIKVAMYPSPVASECQWQRDDGRPHVPEREARWIEVEGGEWQSHAGLAMNMDERIRDAMDASARQQGIELRSWSDYRFQYQARGTGIGDSRLFVHAICRAPAGFDLSKSFYSEPDDHACFFDTTYTNQSYITQPPSAFSPLKIERGADTHEKPTRVFDDR